MYYTHSHKTTFRIPFNSQLASHKSCKKLKLGLDLKINFQEKDKPKSIAIERIDLDDSKIRGLKKLASSIKEIPSEKSVSSSIWYVPSKTELNFYHTIDQSLEVKNFSPFFKGLVHEASKRILILENKGNDPLTIFSLEVDQDFFIVKQGSHSFILNEGEQRSIELHFLPKIPGVFDCNLLINTSVINHSQIVYKLTGSSAYSRSYYKVIDGVQYDRQLMDQAKSLLYKSPQKQLSLKDVQLLVFFATDAHRFTLAEKRTFQYILEKINCSPEAQEWLLNDRTMIWTKIPDFQMVAYWLNTQDLIGNPVALSLKEIAKNEFGLDKLEIQVLEEEAREQSRNYRNRVSLEDAFRKSLISFLEDANDYESPRSLMMEHDPSLVRSKFPDEKSYLQAVKERILFHLNQGKMELVFERYGGPPKGEFGWVKMEWIFYMKMDSYSDHLHWAIVNRTTGQTHNYGFN